MNAGRSAVLEVSSPPVRGALPHALPASVLDERLARQVWLSACAVRPQAGVDDLPGVLARFPVPSLRRRQWEDYDATELPAFVASSGHPVEASAWGGHGTGEGRTFTLRVGLGGARLACTDAARGERARERVEAAIRRDVDQAAAYLAAGFELPEVVSSRRVVEWSPKSRARMVRTLAGLDYAPMDVPGTVAGMVTLTYPGDWLAVAPSGRVVKAHVRAFLERWVRAFGWRPPGLWKLEFQRRGAPHLHLYVPVPALAPSPFCAVHEVADCRCWTFERWLSRTWADVVGAEGDERARHELAGTGVDFAAASRYSDPRRLGIYFLGHGTKTTDGKEYQHIVPEAWRTPEASPGRFWGVWGLDGPEGLLDLDKDEFFAVRRVLRRLLRARNGLAAYQRAKHEPGPSGAGARNRAALAARGRRTRTLGAGGQLTGGWVLANDGLALAIDLARFLQERRFDP